MKMLSHPRDPPSLARHCRPTKIIRVSPLFFNGCPLLSATRCRTIHEGDALGPGLCSAARREEWDPRVDGDNQKSRQRQKILRFFTQRRANFCQRLGNLHLYPSLNYTRHSMGFDPVQLEDRPKAASLQKTTHTVHQSVEETLIQSPQKSHDISVK